jgi:hypothetical protein
VRHLLRIAIALTGFSHCWRHRGRGVGVRLRYRDPIREAEVVLKLLHNEGKEHPAWAINCAKRNAAPPPGRFSAQILPP